jgi:hypothetical protein
MNDDFLTKFRQSPRPEFAQALYVRLAQDGKTHKSTGWSPAARRAALVLAALCLAFALALAVSPAVRAAVEDILAKEIPEQMRTGEGETYAEIWTPASPDQIAADHPFFARFPTWVPSGYKLQRQAALFYGSMYQEMPSHALVQWKNARGETIQLDVTKGSCLDGSSEDSANMGPDCTLASYFSVGLENEPQVIAVTDQPAILFRGVFGLADLSGTIREWNPSRGTWNTNPEAGYSLIWENERRTFFLVVSSRRISEKGVIRIAESIP